MSSSTWLLAGAAWIPNDLGGDITLEQRGLLLLLPQENAAVGVLQSAKMRTAAVMILLVQQGLVVSATELAVMFEGKEDALVVVSSSLLVIRASFSRVERVCTRPSVRW
jgi:hypothetical protein